MIIWFLTLALGKSLKIMVVDETLGIPSHDIHETQDSQHCPPGTLSGIGTIYAQSASIVSLLISQAWCGIALKFVADEGLYGLPYDGADAG